MDEQVYIGCLGWFWNRNESRKTIGILANYFKDEEYPEQNSYYSLDGFSYDNFEPAKEKDVVFYEDKALESSARRKAKRELANAIEYFLMKNIEYYERSYPEGGEYLDEAIEDKLHYQCLEDDTVVEKTLELLKTL